MDIAHLEKYARKEGNPFNCDVALVRDNTRAERPPGIKTALFLVVKKLHPTSTCNRH